MRVFRGKDRSELPVVTDDDSQRLIGVVDRSHLIDAYNSELMKRDMVAGFRGSLAAAAGGEIELGQDYRMAEIEAPGALIGHSLRELDVRARYRGQILLLKRPSSAPGRDTLELVPGPDTVIQRGDRVVIVARQEDLDRLRTL